jgi:hypothetical protein
MGTQQHPSPAPVARQHLRIAVHAHVLVNGKFVEERLFKKHLTVQKKKTPSHSQLGMHNIMKQTVS